MLHILPIKLVINLQNRWSTHKDLIKPSAKDLVECMIDKKYIKHIDKVPLSNNTVSRHICSQSNICQTELIR